MVYLFALCVRTGRSFSHTARKGGRTPYFAPLDKKNGKKFGGFRKTLYLCTRKSRNVCFMHTGSGLSAVGSAHVWGARGRWFESSSPDQRKRLKTTTVFSLFLPLCCLPFRSRLLVAVFYHVPVDNLPQGGKMVWPAVLVVEVVGVFPNVEGQQGLQPALNWIGRICLLGDDKFAR